MNFNGNRAVPCKLLLDSKYSVKRSDVIKSFDCILKFPAVIMSIFLTYVHLIEKQTDLPE